MKKATHRSSVPPARPLAEEMLDGERRRASFSGSVNRLSGVAARSRVDPPQRRRDAIPARPCRANEEADRFGQKPGSALAPGRAAGCRRNTKTPCPAERGDQRHRDKAADDVAQRKADEHEADQRRAQPRRRIFRGQRDGVRHCAAEFRSP